MIKKLKLSIILLILSTAQSYALIEVDITRGNLDPLPIAVSPLSADKDTNEKLTKELKIDKVGHEISSVVENNLRNSGLFNPLNNCLLYTSPSPRDS